MMLFNDFVHKKKIKNKTTSIVNLQQINSSLLLGDVGIYLKNGAFESDMGSVILHLSKETHWVAFINDFFSIYLFVFLLIIY